MDVDQQSELTSALRVAEASAKYTLSEVEFELLTSVTVRRAVEAGTQLIRKHGCMARAVLEQHQGREIDQTDGCLWLFTRPIYALDFALDYLCRLMHLSAAESILLRARDGVRMGDVLLWRNPAEDIRRGGAKPIKVEGLAKPIAARLAPHIHHNMLSGLRVITGKEISVQSTWHCMCCITPASAADRIQV